MSQTPAAPDTEYSTAYNRFVLVMLTIVYAFNFIDRQILVILQEPIKALGIYNVTVKLATEVEASIRVWVVKE